MRKVNAFSFKRQIVKYVSLGILFFIIICIQLDYSYASSESEKAIDAYDSLLSSKSFDRYLGTYDTEDMWASENCRFCLAYIDDDDVPELLVMNMEDSDHAEGWGVIYSFSEGKIGIVDQSSSYLATEVDDTIGYYEKTGWFMSFGMWQGYGSVVTKRMGTDEICSKDYEANEEGMQLKGYTVGGASEISEEEYNSLISESTMGRPLTPYKFYDNTKENRNRYLLNAEQEPSSAKKKAVMKDPRRISFVMSSEKKDYRLSANCSDSFFNKSSYTYNHKLALLTLCVELSSWTADYSSWGEDADDNSETAKKRYKNLEKAFSDMCFEDPVYYNYGKSLNDASDKVAFAIAKNNRTGVIAIVIRGGGYGCEWRGNFIVGKGSKDHSGWDSAAQDVYEKTISYIEKQDIDNVKLWITGYSRGAAVASLVTKKFNTYADKTSKINKKNIYAYTFATPQAIYNGDSADAKNVFNIVNPGDAVSTVAPTSWGYSRIGTTKYFSDDISSKAAVKVERRFKQMTNCDIDVYKNMKQQKAIKKFQKVLSNIYPEANSSYKIQQVFAEFVEFTNTKSRSNGKWKQCSEEEFFKKLIDRYGKERFFTSYQYAKTYLSETKDGKLVTSLIEENCKKNYQSYLPIFYTLVYLHDADADDISKLIKKASKSENVLSVMFGLIDFEQKQVVSTLGDGLQGIEYAHYAQLYYSWMKLGEDDAFTTKKIFRPWLILEMFKME